MAVLVVLAVAVAAYLLGSIPTGFLVAKGLKGIDIREHGSGTTGATNVLRTVGKGAAIAVLLIDLLKGLIAVLLVTATMPLLLSTDLGITAPWQPWLEVLAGLMALVGHSRSIWINFTGGKSAASGLGVVLALSWPVALGAIAIFALVLALSRIVSLGSMAGAIAILLLMIITGQPLAYILLAVAGGGYVILRHRANIKRILAGQEPRLGGASSHPQ
ncbi:acyl-phosphate glycerol 3-phosphate acyltransferase [filamentous cyanobacterium CCP5]|nr:acyl-phosphate glycerol 3-phosphate acyltransferase [filamentous cyanobacterium CCP5]